MTGTVVKILANNPSPFSNGPQRLGKVSKVTATSNEMILTPADGAVEGTVTFTFHVELNDPAAKGPLHVAEWPNLAWANAAENTEPSCGGKGLGLGVLAAPTATGPLVAVDS